MVGQVLCVYVLVIIVVSTSSISWSQVRRFFLMRIVFVLLTMMNNMSLFCCLYCLFFLYALVCNTVGLHNSLLFTIVQFAQ